MVVWRRFTARHVVASEAAEDAPAVERAVEDDTPVPGEG
jgi:hypothetical protein